MTWAKLHLWLRGHLSSGFQGEKTEKMTQKIIFHCLKIEAFWRIAQIQLSVGHLP